jgi:choline dehydrogenase-like flavoprotein
VTINQDYDAIIVGSGPGGASTARELALKGKKVLILEWGPGKPVRGTIWQYITEQCWPGKGLLFVYRNMLGMVRGITTGGSSLFYYASCFPVPHRMLERYGIDVRREEKEIRRELPIAPLKDAMVTPMATRIMESARSLGHDWKLLDKFMYQDRWRPGDAFGYYGDPKNIKWSARMYVGEAVANGAEMLNNAKVTGVILEGDRAKGVEFIAGGKTHRVFADNVVLSAGGIGTPVILRTMGIREAGKNFFYDPLISVCGKVDSAIKRADEIPMSAGCHLPDEGIVMTDMALPTFLDRIFTLQVLRFWRLFETRKTLRIMIKVRDDLAGRLTDRGGVRKNLTSADRAKLNRGYEIAREILHRAGARGVYRTWYLAAHPGGTVKLGEFLDSNLAVKNYSNLFVCDCSAIPEPWGLPPTLTLLCLGRRLGRFLAGKKASAAAAPRSRTGKKPAGRTHAKKSR